MIIKHLNLFIIICIAFFPAIGVADKRVDFDKRLYTDNPEAFYSFQTLFYEGMLVSLADEKFKVSISKGEKFYDIYLDTPSHTLFKKKISLRFRKRFINGLLAKQLLQLKMPEDLGNAKGAYWEQKSAIPVGKVIDETSDILKYVNQNRRNNRSVSKFVADRLNVDQLVPLIYVHQTRNRIYLSDQNNVVTYTITFDEMTSFSNLKIVPSYFVEIELSEKIATSLKQDELESKIRSMDEIKTKFLNVFMEASDTKLAFSLSRLQIQPKKVVENLLVWWIVIAGIVLILGLKIYGGRNRR